MTYVYLLRSEVNKEQTYIGSTINLKERLTAHNQGISLHTAKFKPWKLISYLAFEDRVKALAMEKYLKTGSGRAFAKRHFW